MYNQSQHLYILQQSASSDPSSHDAYPLHTENFDKHLVLLSQRNPRHP